MAEPSFEQCSDLAKKLESTISESIFGQKELIEDALCALIAGGHILMTGAPGLAKTTLVRVIATNLSVKFGRIQFTPDLLPSDIMGAEILNVDPESGKRIFSFSKGPVFTNLLLADEINRASPRTQSALLEAMQERTVTVGGKLHRIEPPFMVFATQNPFESEGTFPLPEAQLDRFLLHSLVKYPSEEAESKLLAEHVNNKLVGESSSALENKEPLLQGDQVMALMNACKSVHFDPELVDAIRKLVRSTRPGETEFPSAYEGKVWYGAGPRAGISLVAVSRAYALLQGESRVRWQHIKRMAPAVLRHRIKLTSLDGGQDREDQFIGSMIESLEGKQNLAAHGIS